MKIRLSLGMGGEHDEIGLKIGKGGIYIPPFKMELFRGNLS
jgi:hypothetical protein